MPERRPNILLVMFDQLAPQSLAIHGHPLTRTPQLDRLAREAVVFDNAYCAAPLCAPARFSLLAGQLGSRIGAYDNASEFSAATPTLSHYLRRLGYRTALCGKMHFVGPDQLHGFERRLTTDMYPADFGWTPDWLHPEHRPFWYHNMQSVVEAGVYERTLELDFDEEVAYHGEHLLYDLARDEDPRPWFVTVSFMHPHDPFMTPRRYWELYDHAAIDMPRHDAPPAAPEPHSQRLQRLCAMEEYRVSEHHVRNARHAYYAMISWGDEQLGRLLLALEVTGQREDTVVVVTSDHGEMLGERGLWYKMNFFERSVRVPLIVHHPRRFGARRVGVNVSHLDLLPTLVGLAQADTSAEALEFATAIDGRDLRGVLRGEASAGEDCIAAEYLAEGTTAPMFMLKRGRFKFISCDGDPPQLFDCSADPDERENLAGSARHAVLAEGFAAEVARRWDAEALRERILESQRMRSFVHQAGMCGEPPRWDFQPMVDASRRYNRNYGAELYDSDRRARIPRRPPPVPDGPGR